MIILFSLLMVIGCSNSYTEDIKRGSFYEYVPGLPELWFEPAGVISTEGTPMIKVAGTIPKSSLIYKNAEGTLSASISVNIEVLNTNSGQSISDSFRETIPQNDRQSALNEELYNFYKEYEVSPGTFNVIVSVMDQATGKLVVREKNAVIPKLSDEVQNVTNIRLLAKGIGNTDDFIPIPTYDVNNTADSLKFEFQVANTTNNDSPLIFNARLIKFRQIQPLSPLLLLPTVLHQVLSSRV